MAQFKQDKPGVSNIADARTLNYIFQLVENLEYVLQNMGPENFPPEVWNRLTAMPSAKDVGALPEGTQVSDLSGILGVPNGGSGNKTLPVNRLLIGADGDPVKSLDFPAEASILMQDAGAPYFKTPAAMLQELSGFFATWGNYGRILDTNYNFNYYANLVMSLLSPTKAVLHMTGKMGTNFNSATYVRYGISISALTAQITSWLATLGYTVSSVSFQPSSQWKAWKFTDGTLLYNAMEYGTCFQVDSTDAILRPARVYDTAGAIGGWEIGTWYAGGFYFDADIYTEITLT